MQEIRNSSRSSHCSQVFGISGELYLDLSVNSDRMF